MRTITAFISLSTSDYKRELADTALALNTAKKKFEQSGWVVETIRITTQPFPEFLRGLPRAKALELLIELDNLAAGNYEFNVGPAMMKDSDDPAMMDLAAEFLARAKVTNSSAIIALLSDPRGEISPVIVAKARLAEEPLWSGESISPVIAFTRRLAFNTSGFTSWNSISS